MNIKHKRIRPTFLFGYWILFSTDTVSGVSFVSLGSEDGFNTFHCNTKVQLICSTSTVPVNFNLRINEVNAAYCIITSCTVVPEFQKDYTILANASLGEITVWINKTSGELGSVVFKCEAKGKVITLHPFIKVLPKHEEIQITFSIKGNKVTVKMTTGCVLPRDLLFEYYTSPTDDFKNLESLNRPKTNYTDNSICVPKDNCLATGVSSEITFFETGCGEPRYVYGFIRIPHDSKDIVKKLLQQRFRIDECKTEAVKPTPISGAALYHGRPIFKIIIACVLMAFL